MVLVIPVVVAAALAAIAVVVVAARLYLLINIDRYIPNSSQLLN